ncbi:sugar ABC transporter ATP-binding protein [Sutcliffiella halmapala]|uniref:sugar ABC transporter ATP-binding protein n=1 Tax=Sutcliffiella halmapala TaxID=79882 RepID=UPI0009959B07|nr:sugar ABC transporter ATP-binding protein [Sutcliffiella halmapala]
MDSEQLPLLQMEEMFKQFSGNKVLNGVSLTLNSKEVHAIVGGNGAGKSTLMKIITGLYPSDGGKMIVKGKQVRFRSTSEAHQHGIYLVPQEPLIFSHMTVEENMTIGLPGSRAELKEKVRKLVKKLGWKLKLNQTAMSLSIAEQQLVEIIRGLAREAEILILDEPTSTLTFGEIDSLFETIQQLKESGIGILYITHRFTEIFRLADKVSVLRDGVISAQGPTKEFTYDRLLESLMPEGETKATESGNSNAKKDASPNRNQPKPILQVEQLFGERFQDINLAICPGEILGVAGVVGAGRTELAESIAGIRKVTNGVVWLDGKEIQSLTVRERIDHGLIYVPEDRHKHGVFSITSIQSNISSTILHRLSKFFLPFTKEGDLASSYVKQLRIKGTSTKQQLQELSGGNQQKVVLAKCLAASPKIIILDEPTRGIDANARQDIYHIIQALKQEGLAVLLISSDIEEVVSLSDKVVVLYEGKIVKRCDGRDELTPDTIASFAFGINREVPLK